ncbi:hypothetical protein ACI65C_005555 [Semiaphis heraclei]
MKRFLVTSSENNKKCIKEAIDIPSPASPGLNESMVHNPSTSSNSAQEIDKITNNYLFDGTFYKVISIIDNKLTADCQSCNKTIHGQINSTGNFLKHFKNKHSSVLSTLQAKKNEKKKLSNASLSEKGESTLANFSNKQLKLPYSQIFQPKQISKQTIVNLVFDYIIDEMRPLVTCEKVAFKNLIMGLTGITDASYLPDSKVMKRELKSRCSYVLGCRRVKGSHTYLNIAKGIIEILKTFNIKNSKITHCVTDNASNFGKAFRTFSMQSQKQNVAPTTISLENFNESSSDIGSEVDDTNSNVDVVELSNIFLDSNELVNEYDDDISLPEHLTCAAHTLSLIATSDISKISDISYKKISKSVFEKLQSFWNIISRSSVASDKIYDICNCKFPVPILTRWNSMFNAVKKILANKEKLLCGFDELKINKLKIIEWKFLEEYCLVMEPLALALDKLQGEKSIFLGYVAPTIIALRLRLIQASHLTHCRPLSLLVIKSLEKRFDYIYKLETLPSKTFILASISHPNFKLNWVPVRYKKLCKQLFLSECDKINAVEKITENASEDEHDGASDNEFYNILNGADDDFEGCNSGDTVGENRRENNNLASVQALSYLDCKNKELSLLDNFPIVKQVFLKYNMSLPSSAPVERLFSSGSQILTPRRNRLSDTVFEMLLCCRCNQNK